VNFQAVLMQPIKGQTKRLRTVLNNMYAHLDSAGMAGNVKDEVSVIAIYKCNYVLHCSPMKCQV
jgi:hypothetical protein